MKFPVEFGQIRWIKPRRFQRCTQEIAIHPADGIGIDNILGRRGQDHLLVILRRAAFGGRDEARAEISEIRPRRPRRHHMRPGGHGAR